MAGKKMTVWVCTKCGKKLLTAEKPDEEDKKDCKASSTGMHSYVRA